MSKFRRGYKFQIYPTEEQANQIDDFIDQTRYVYNWGIAKEKERYKEYLDGDSKYCFYNYFDLDKEFRKYLKNNSKEWYSLPVTTAKYALRNVVNAFNRFFKGSGFPKFKCKRTCKNSFNTRNDRFKIKNNCIRIEGISSYISLGFDSGFNLDRVINPVITRDNIGNYYVSFSLEEESVSLDIPKSEGIGIDLGVRQTIVLSTGEVFNQPKEKLAKLDHQLRTLQHYVSHDSKRRQKHADRMKAKCEDIPMSKRAKKRRTKLNKLYKKIHNIKNTFYHTTAKNIVDRNPEFICMETFSVREMESENKSMHKILCGTSFYGITTTFKQKCNQRNILFIQSPREFASTQICSSCGSIKNMKGKHTYICPVCGMVEDRDINAAKNLKQYGLDLLYSNIGKTDEFIFDLGINLV